jgi:hypothetical protein
MERGCKQTIQQDEEEAIWEVIDSKPIPQGRCIRSN